MTNPFPYVGLALTAGEFADYVQRFNFGAVPPDFVVLHHTAIPAASYAPAGDPDTYWDSNEAGLYEQAVKAKRLGRLGGVRNYYRDVLGWHAGPHLFVDDRFIYLMTPMNTIGIHAMWANSFTRAGKLHYSIGIEVIGCFTTKRWPAAVQANVRAAVTALQQRLQTFTLDYMYADGVKPGSATRLIDGQRVQYCPRPDLLRWGGLSSHRDYNKPACPGDAITEQFYLDVIRGSCSPSAVQTQPMKYRVKQGTDFANVREGRGTNYSVALGGTLKLVPGTLVTLDDITAGWGHLATGEGFVAMSLLEPLQ